MKRLNYLPIIAAVVVGLSAAPGGNAMATPFDTCFSCWSDWWNFEHGDGYDTSPLDGDFRGKPHSGSGTHPGVCAQAHIGPIFDCPSGGPAQENEETLFSATKYERLIVALEEEDLEAVRGLLLSTPKLFLNLGRGAIQASTCDGLGVQLSLNLAASMAERLGGATYVGVGW